MPFSVIICTHNPRPDYLRRVLEALQGQTLPRAQWELLLIDNASAEPLARKWDISWHPQARHVRENELGLTAARLRGITESKGELLVFVDDDNVLRPDFLSRNTEMSLNHKWVGSWGGGITAEFEVTPPEHLRPYFGNIAIQECTVAEWVYMPGYGAAPFAPCGAGLSIRRKIALKYAEITFQNGRRLLDRKGPDLTSAGDTDLALTACDLGMAVGRFPQLQLRHLIPAQRLTEAYFVRLQEGLSYSHTMLRWWRDGVVPAAAKKERSRSQRLLELYTHCRNFLDPGLRHALRFDKRMDQARTAGIERALAWIASEQAVGQAGGTRTPRDQACAHEIAGHL